MILDFGNGQILVKDFVQGKLAGVILSGGGKGRIGERDKSFQTCVIYEEKTLRDEGIVLRFSNVESVDVLLDALKDVREAIAIGGET